MCYKLSVMVVRLNQRDSMNVLEDNPPVLIKALREKFGLTQEEFARRLGVSFASVNRWENGQTKPSKLAWRQIKQLRTDYGKLPAGEATTHGH
jgi:putative transcriptional regulator